MHSKGSGASEAVPENPSETSRQEKPMHDKRSKKTRKYTQRQAGTKSIYGGAYKAEQVRHSEESRARDAGQGRRNKGRVATEEK